MEISVPAFSETASVLAGGAARSREEGGKERGDLPGRRYEFRDEFQEVWLQSDRSWGSNSPGPKKPPQVSGLPGLSGGVPKEPVSTPSLSYSSSSPTPSTSISSCSARSTSWIPTRRL
ncbi:hypothetical protein EYF80_045003 [Liparis tanakae]|uniref:Uncharacterized protein n=1 Tax=Liparis tanakae TaxID=230148 RepID=A0A4Z2FUV1_9TELE|nr:hypothetical protein EYF80_045003 [Liparis tanakae]